METLKSQLTDILLPFKFKEKPFTMIGTEFGMIHGWKRQSWNANYGVALIELKGMPRSIDTAYIQRVSTVVGKALGYITFFNPIGVHLIFVGDGVQDRIYNKENFVDKVQTFAVLVQNVFLVDTSTSVVEKSQTWGQIKAGKFRDEIEKCLHNFLDEKST